MNSIIAGGIAILIMGNCIYATEDIPEIIVNLQTDGLIVLHEKIYTKPKELPPLRPGGKHNVVVRIEPNAPQVQLYDTLVLLRERGYKQIELRFVRKNIHPDGTVSVEFPNRRKSEGNRDVE